MTSSRVESPCIKDIYGNLEIECALKATLLVDYVRGEVCFVEAYSIVLYLTKTQKQKGYAKGFGLEKGHSNLLVTFTAFQGNQKNICPRVREIEENGFHWQLSMTLE